MKTKLGTSAWLILGTSSVENKYETIGKSISPYKIPNEVEEDPEFIPSNKHVHVSIRRQLELQHPSPTSALAESRITLQQLLQQASPHRVSHGAALGGGAHKVSC